jgi:hypothetical protein
MSSDLIEYLTKDIIAEQEAKWQTRMAETEARLETERAARLQTERETVASISVCFRLIKRLVCRHTP